MKAAADSVQKLWSESHLCMRIPRVAPQGRTRRPTLCLLILNKILIAWPMLIVTMPSKVNSKHPKSTGRESGKIFLYILQKISRYNCKWHK